jgi:hypothetical protein
MEEHFELASSIYLVAASHKLDLHNNYDFQGVEYSTHERSAALRWHRGDGDWVPADLPSFIELRYEGVERFEFHRRDPEMPFTEDDCLANAGYWTDEDWADGVFDASPDPDSDWLRAFQFQSGAIILIRASTGTAIIKES